MSKKHALELFHTLPSLIAALLVLALCGCPSQPSNNSPTTSGSADAKSPKDGDSSTAKTDLASDTSAQLQTEADKQPTSQPATDSANPNSSNDSASESTHNQTASSKSDSKNPRSGAATLNSATSSSASPSPTTTPNKIPSGNWTTQRLIAATPRGPAVIDLKIRTGESDLDSASSSAVEPIAKSLIEKLDQPPTWTGLVALPLVKSGWLGNLTAESNAIDQLIGMYDTNKDQQVQPEELKIFLTRGLARNSTIQVSDIGTEAIEDSSYAQLGTLDSNQDNVISSEELDQGVEQLKKLDFNGDSIISLNELSPSSRNPTMMAGRRSNSMLRATSLVFEPAVSEGETNRLKQRQRKAVELMEIYSFLGQVEQQQWPNWSKQQWSMLDSDSDGNLSKAEVATIFEKPLATSVALRLPSLAEDSEIPKWFAEFNQEWIWKSSANGARISDRSLCLQFEVEELFNKRIKSILKTQLNLALNNAQTKQFLIQQLQLKDNAIELADANGDKKLQDEEFLMVWSWLSARQSARLQVRWMLTARPWFQLLDTDGNQSLSEQEIQQVKSTMLQFDEDKDGEVSIGELPMVAKLRVSRTDARLNLPPGMTIPEESLASEEDWFNAMDTNRDGSISRAEFLGTDNEFKGADKDSDGFISKTEVY